MTPLPEARSSFTAGSNPTNEKVRLTIISTCQPVLPLLTDALEGNINIFESDEPFVAPSYLFQLVQQHRLQINQVYQIAHRGATSSSHLVLCLTDGRHVCDCCMKSNLGVPCRHFFATMAAVPTMCFHIGSVRPR